MPSHLTQPIKWHGGKRYSADWIIKHVPPHVHYVEPFAGGLAVLLRKDPRGISEVVNDINGELTNFWRVLQNEDAFTRFQRQVEAIPFSQVEWEAAATPHDDPLDRAVAFFVRARQSRQGLMRDFATLSRTRTRRAMNEQVSSWLSAVEGLPDVHARLKRVVILCDEATNVIRQQDGPQTLFYCDPPYLHETRTATDCYQHEMTAEQHAELLDTLAGIEGMFLLSGYPSQLYDRYASHYGWTRFDQRIDNKASASKTKPMKIECLWTNRPPLIGRIGNMKIAGAREYMAPEHPNPTVLM